MAAYEEYQKCGTELTLRNDLFRIYKIESNSHFIQGMPKSWRDLAIVAGKAKA